MRPARSEKDEQAEHDPRLYGLWNPQPLRKDGSAMSAGYVVFPHLIAGARLSLVFGSTLYKAVSLTVLAVVVVFPSVLGIRRGLRLATHRPFIQNILRAATIATLMLFAIEVMNLWWITVGYTHAPIPDVSPHRLKSVHFGVYWPLVYLVVIAVARCRQSRGAAEIAGT